MSIVDFSVLSIVLELEVVLEFSLGEIQQSDQEEHEDEDEFEIDYDGNLKQRFWEALNRDRPRVRTRPRILFGRNIKKRPRGARGRGRVRVRYDGEP